MRKFNFIPFLLVYVVILQKRNGIQPRLYLAQYVLAFIYKKQIKIRRSKDREERVRVSMCVVM